MHAKLASHQGDVSQHEREAEPHPVGSVGVKSFCGPLDLEVGRGGIDDGELGTPGSEATDEQDFRRTRFDGVFHEAAQTARDHGSVRMDRFPAGMPGPEDATLKCLR